MPTDAKFGLVLGVGLVVTVAVVFFRKEPEAPVGSPAPVVAAPALPPPLPTAGFPVPTVDPAAPGHSVSRVKFEQE